MTALGTSRRRRRPCWPRPGGRSSAAGDLGGPALLGAIARTVDDRAPEVAKTRVVVRHAPIERDRYRTARDDRAWRAAVGGREFWCVMDAASQRVLLEFVLAGPASAVLTAVERSIVADALLRLLDPHLGTESGRLREEFDARPAGDFWRCNIDLCDRAGSRATLQAFVAIDDPPPARPAALEIGSVPIRIEATLPPIGMRLDDILAWQTQSHVRLTDAADLVAELSAGDAKLAEARLGSVGTKRALHVTRVGCAWTS
mgnify:CR=1 FL=1